MNSKQRRVDQRKFKYSIEINHETYGNYVEAWEWLNKHYGRNSAECGWRDRHKDLDYAWGNWEKVLVRWEFTKEKTLVAFALTFGGD